MAGTCLKSCPEPVCECIYDGICVLWCPVPEFSQTGGGAALCGSICVGCLSGGAGKLVEACQEGGRRGSFIKHNIV